MAASRDRSGWAWAACLAAAPVLARPIDDPDLWWHLSAGRWIAEHRAVPAADWLSHTMAGKAWTDFEWLSQLSFWAADRCAGPAGLWALKAGLLGCAVAVVHSMLKGLGLPAFWRAFGAAFWCAAVIPRADLRTELFSVLAFALLLRRLRLGPAPGPAAAFLSFCLWANLHAGFVYGLALLGVFAAFDAPRRGRLSLALAAGAAGTLLNPYGWDVYGVLWEHARALEPLRRFIVEWAPLTFRRTSHWPTWLLLAGWAALLARAWRRGGRAPSPAMAAATALFGLGVLRHSRLMVFFATLSVPAALELAASSGVLDRVRRSPAGRLARALGPRAVAPLCAAGFFAALWWGRWDRAFEGFVRESDFPARTAAWLEEQPGLEARTAYNPWEWGGYLGWRLGPRLRVFQDGRYLFHPLLEEENEALRSPETWQAYLDRRGVDLAILKSPARRDCVAYRWFGEREGFRRRDFLRYMPPARWRLARFDEQALVYVRRTLDNVGGRGPY